MYLSWKTASALFVLALVGTVGCAAGGGEAPSDDATLTAPAADAQKPTDPAEGRGEVDVTVNVDEIGSNDGPNGGHSCGHGQGWGHGHHHGGHHGSHDGSSSASPLPTPPAPPPAPAPANPS